jgi:two-component system CheB/CheR fusion protein
MVRDANDAITLQDDRGNIIAWNRGAVKLYGYSEAEALRLNIKDLTPPQSRAKMKGLPETPAEGGADSFVTERLAKNGAIIRVWLTATQLVDDRGKPTFIATTERDLSKLNKEALENLRREDDAQGK